MKIFASGMLKFLVTYLLVGPDKNNQPQHRKVLGLTVLAILTFSTHGRALPHLYTSPPRRRLGTCWSSGVKKLSLSPP